MVDIDWLLSGEFDIILCVNVSLLFICSSSYLTVCGTFIVRCVFLN